MQTLSSARVIPRCFARIACSVFSMVCALGAIGTGCTPAQADTVAGAGVHDDVVFDAYSPLASSEERLRRLLRPLAAERVRALITASTAAVREQSIDLAAERFAYYVPHAQMPTSGYGLLVYVSPADAAKIPSTWTASLDRHAMIAVTMAKAGNDEAVIDRRIPLALSAYVNVAKRFRIDASRVYVAGLSGGSRVALHIALGYPDRFRAALLNAGADTFGSADLALPPPDLQRLFEDRSRLVYVTGGRDAVHLAMDAHSRESARDNCVLDLVTLAWPNAGHQPMDAAIFERALQALDAPPADQSETVENCRARRAADIDKRIAYATSLIVSGHMESAQRELDAIDVRFGGLATPQSIALFKRLDAHEADHAPNSRSR